MRAVKWYEPYSPVVQNAKLIWTGDFPIISRAAAPNWSFSDSGKPDFGTLTNCLALGFWNAETGTPHANEPNTKPTIVKINYCNPLCIIQALRLKGFWRVSCRLEKYWASLSDNELAKGSILRTCLAAENSKIEYVGAPVRIWPVSRWQCLLIRSLTRVLSTHFEFPSCHFLLTYLLTSSLGLSTSYVAMTML